MNKKNITLTIIAVVTLLIVVVSATFAYFTAIINTEGNSTTIVSGSAESVGTVSLSNPTDYLHITLSATDMASDNLGVYYATDSETANYDTNEVQRNIAVATVSGGATSTKYECSATINIALSGTMAESLVAGDAYVQFGGILDDKVHLSKIASDGYKVVFQLDGDTNTIKSVSASIAIENKRQNQNNLAGKTLSATFSNDDFSCKVVKEYSDTSKTAFAIYSKTDNSLKFYKRENVPEVGDIYNGNAVTEIYTGFETEIYNSGENPVPWTMSMISVEVVDEISPISTAAWFYDSTNCESFDVTNLDVSNITDMSEMFQCAGCYAETVEIKGLEGWDVSNVTNMKHMFSSAGEQVQTFDIGDLSNWDTSSVTNMSSMFSGAGLEVTTFDIGDISSWDTSNVSDMSGMFQGTGNNADWSLDLSGWDVSKVTNYTNFNLNVESKVTPPNWVTTS